MEYDRGAWKLKNSSNISYSSYDTIENIYPDEGVWIRESLILK